MTSLHDFLLSAKNLLIIRWKYFPFATLKNIPKKITTIVSYRQGSSARCVFTRCVFAIFHRGFCLLREKNSLRASTGTELKLLTKNVAGAFGRRLPLNAESAYFFVKVASAKQLKALKRKIVLNKCEKY